MGGRLLPAQCVAKTTTGTVARGTRMGRAGNARIVAKGTTVPSARGSPLGRAGNAGGVVKDCFVWVAREAHLGLVQRARRAGLALTTMGALGARRGCARCVGGVLSVTSAWVAIRHLLGRVCWSLWLILQAQHAGKGSSAPLGRDPKYPAMCARPQRHNTGGYAGLYPTGRVGNAAGAVQNTTARVALEARLGRARNAGIAAKTCTARAARGTRVGRVWRARRVATAPTAKGALEPRLGCASCARGVIPCTSASAVLVHLLELVNSFWCKPALMREHPPLSIKRLSESGVSPCQAPICARLSGCTRGCARWKVILTHSVC